MAAVDSGPSAPPVNPVQNSHLDHPETSLSFLYSSDPADTPDIHDLLRIGEHKEQIEVPNIAEQRGNLLDSITKQSPEVLESDLKNKYLEDIKKAMKDPKDEDSPTILHWVAQKLKFDRTLEANPIFKAARFLAEVATSLDPTMLSIHNRKNSMNPIHLFIEYAASNAATRPAVNKIILAVCKAACNSSDIDGKKHVTDAISSLHKSLGNCLHMAIKNDLEISEQLVEMASKEAVIAATEDGNTPLHEAVDPNLFTFTTAQCKLSPSTCPECQASTRALLAKSIRIKSHIIALVTKNPEVLRKKNAKDHSPYLHRQQTRKKPTVIAPMNKSPEVKKDKEDPLVEIKVADNKACKSVESNLFDMAIEEILVEGAFNLGSFEMACECFFGSKSHIEQMDSVFRPERPLSVFDPENTYNFLKCGDTLAQVDISIDPTEDKENKDHNVTESMIHDARKALEQIFKVLRKKEVRRILQLKVRDNQKSPCSDEFIEECLDGFDIRYLSWNKPDLCADVIIAKAPRVAELWLNTTGSTAVLRGWAGSNGLSNLLQLRSVHIESDESLEIISYERHSRMIKEFHEDLRTNVKITRRFEVLKKFIALGNLEETKHRVEERQCRDKLVALEAQPPKNLSVELMKAIPLLQAHRHRMTNLIHEWEKRKEKLNEGFDHYLREKETSREGIVTRLRSTKKQFAGKDLKMDQNIEDGQRVKEEEHYNGRENSKEVPDEIDISELKKWGVEKSSDFAAKTDYIPLTFSIDLPIPERLTKRGTRLTLKSSRKDETSSKYHHRWIQSLKKFVSEHVPENDSGFRVKIALIDDGVDSHLGDLNDKVKAGWPREPPTSTHKPFYLSTGGHGTSMARLITTACPHVDLYVAKLQTLSNVISKNVVHETNGDLWKSTAEEASRAIEWAVSQKVHIISMSWTLVATPGTQQAITNLSEQISQAAKQNIIMYCAAADQGKYGVLKDLYPASAATPHIKVVGSATENGHSSGFVLPEQVNYLFPGEEFEDLEDQKGSSAATALATGFAALIIWCYGVSKSENNNKMASERNNKMANPLSMSALFEDLQLELQKKINSKDPQKWVDASILLGSSGISSVVEYVDKCRNI